MAHSQPYSGSNPIPKVGDFLQSTGHKITPGKSSKASSQHPSTKEEAKQLKAGKSVSGGNRRTVTDPTTGKEVEIEDAVGDYKESADNPTLVVPKNMIPEERETGAEKPYSEATQPRETYEHNQDVTAPPGPYAEGTTADVPIHGEKTNILFHPTPTLSLEGTVFAEFEQKALYLVGGLFGGIIVLGSLLGGGSIYVLVLLAAGASSGVWYWSRTIVEEARHVDWESEKKRGETAVSNLIPESVEWMNSLVGLVWGLVNPEMFSSISDMLEDVMQASAPGVIENVRVADINQGVNPVRILSLRALPENEAEDLKKGATEGRAGRDKQELLAEEEGGEVYNLEVSFAYNAAPVDRKGLKSKARNMHMQIVFYAGIKGLFGVPLPIWVELKGLIGTVRLRIHLSPDAPYLKTLTYTLMGIPQVSVACIPMLESGINVLNLPIISQFVNASIATACAEYVAPKSMTMEIGKMLMGDDVKKDTEAIGVLWVEIHKAVGLSQQDRSGSSDSYITLAFSKYGKPMYSTRVIVDDLNPIWNESTAILVNAEHVKASESLAVELWDSDRFSADDLTGKVEIPLQDIMMSPGKMHAQKSKLSGDEAGSTMPGELFWSVGFFGKHELRPALRTSGKDVNLPKEIQDHPQLQDDKGSLDTEGEDAIMHTPPDPLFPSGIVSVIVHQIVNLEIRDQSGTFTTRKDGKEYSPGQVTGEAKEEEGGKLPSSYCTVALNDALVYRTRTKVVSSKPIFNAGFERFVRDWRGTMLTIAVRDQRQREHDPLLGVVPLKLSELLQTSSEVTRWFPLDAGLGFGRIRVSVLFRGMELTLPPPLLGWDVGTFCFESDISISIPSISKLKFRTGGSTGKLGRRHADGSDEGTSFSVMVGKKEKHQHRLRLPVIHRYMSPVTIDLFTSSSRKPIAHALLWLDTLSDNHTTPIKLPIWSSSSSPRLTQNYITTPSQRPDLEIEEKGTIEFSAVFKPGMSRDHEKFATDNDARETFEAWSACKGEGLRGDTVKKEGNGVVDALHEQSVGEMRADLSRTDRGEVDAEEEARLRDKYGREWRDVFQAAQKEVGNDNNSGQGIVDPRRTGEDGGYGSDYSSSSSDSSSSSSISSASIGEDFPKRTDTNTDQQQKKGPLQAMREYRENSRQMHRKHRGLMQWKPIRSLAFARDEGRFAARKIRNKVRLSGREPDVETEA